VIIFNSCNKKLDKVIVQESELNTISFYFNKMKDVSLSDSVRLNHSNSVLKLSKGKNVDSTIIKTLSYSIHLYGKTGSYKMAIKNSRLLLEESIKQKDTVSIGSSYFKMAYYFNTTHLKDSAYIYFNLAKDVYLSLNDSVSVGNILTNLAIIQSDFGDYSASDYSATQALKYLKNSSYNYNTSIFNCLAINSRNQNDYLDAVYYYSKALENTKNQQNRFLIENNIANAYRDLKNYKKSISILENIELDSISNKRIKSKIIDNLSYTKWLENGNAKVLPALLSALAIRQQENDLYGLIASYAHLSDYYKNINTKLSLEYISKMYQLAILQKSPQDQLEALQKLIDLDNSPKVKDYYASYIRLNDSLQEAENRVKNKFAKIKYDSEKNREDNLQLKISASEKELELEKEKTRNIIGATSSATVVLGLVGFGYYRRKKLEQEKRAEVYKTETRIAKKIHDEVANDVVNIMNKIQYTEQEPDRILDDLEKVYMLTRDISHENNEIATGENFEFQLKSMLANFNSTGIKIIIKDIHKVEFSLTTKEKQIEIYRILQELMVNMHKHSKATLVVISFKMDKKMCVINYSDNGIGIDTETLILKNGLQNVENRIKAINGTITFESSLQKGFKAFLSFKR